MASATNNLMLGGAKKSNEDKKKRIASNTDDQNASGSSSAPPTPSAPRSSAQSTSLSMPDTLPTALECERFEKMIRIVEGKGTRGEQREIRVHVLPWGMQDRSK